MIERQFEPVIGLEIHVELKTNSKMFCGCAAKWFGSPPNTHCCPVCLGLPGALPVPNKKAIEWCVMLGIALNCEIPMESKFDRKNYFYPDLPKGYQISQYDQPFAINGVLDIEVDTKEKNKKKKKTVRIRRVHMEEDTGKLIHSTVNGEKCTLVDFNRSSVPLVEIVTEPDISGSEEARIFLKKLHQIIRTIGISDADMEKGSMRLEPNISLREVSSSLKDKTRLPGYKVEVKNINSFTFVKKAIDYEIKRHANLLLQGTIPPQETRGWDEKKNETYSQRSKEEAHDYRYFPEPDIPPIKWKKEDIENIKKAIPELPDQKLARFMKMYGLSPYDASILIESAEVAQYFEKALLYTATLKKAENALDPTQWSKIIANWIINKKVDMKQEDEKSLVKRITEKNKVVIMDDTKLQELVKRQIDRNPKAVADFRAGKIQSIMFILGQVMREEKGKGNAAQIKAEIERQLSG